MGVHSRDERIASSEITTPANKRCPVGWSSRWLISSVERGQPESFLGAAQTVKSGLFCQLITIPLFKDHKILVQVAGNGNHVVKLLPALVIDDADCDWIEQSFEKVIADSHQVPGAVWTLGKTMAENARKAAAR